MNTRHVFTKFSAADGFEYRQKFTRLDCLDVSRFAQHVVAYTPTPVEIERLLETAKSEFGSSVSPKTLHRIISSNPDTFHAFNLRVNHDSEVPQAAGFIAWLPLTDLGKQALLDGSFDAADPAPEYVVGQNDRPAAIYIWGLYAPGRLAAGIAWAHQRWSTPLCRDADIYARPVTLNGLRFVERIGFERLQTHEAEHLQKLLVYRRVQGAEAPPPYASYRPGSRGTSVTVARSFEDLARVISLRAAVYMAEQACPYDEEFDGNDLSATHLIGYVDDEPAGCLRIRYFADFAKVERVTVLAKFRKAGLSAALIAAVVELVSMKGYRKLYSHSQKRYVKHWSRFGFRVIEGAKEFVFSDFDYVEVLMDIEPHSRAISIGGDPYVIIRPEGEWHTAGILERSANRPVTASSIAQEIRGRRSAESTIA